MGTIMQAIRRDAYAERIGDALRELRAIRAYADPAAHARALDHARAMLRFAIGWARGLDECARLTRSCNRIIGWIDAKQLELRVEAVSPNVVLLKQAVSKRRRQKRAVASDRRELGAVVIANLAREQGAQLPERTIR